MIPGIPSMGGTELLIVLAIILLFFGAKRIPELARSLGKGTREFRQGIREVGKDEDTNLHEKEDNPSLNEAAAHKESVQ